MSVFKRLTNVARGKVMEIGRTLSDAVPDDEPDEIDPDGPPRRKAESSTAAATTPLDDDAKRTMLDRLLADGLLTEDEHAEKLAALDAPPAPPKARKRTL